MAKVNVEQLKDKSNYLVGDLPQDLANGLEYFSPENQQLLKFHGLYEQEDRDSRKERKALNLDPVCFLMVRIRAPGGKLTADQYLACDALADKYANGTVRLTSRQAIQFHGIFKRNVAAHMRELNEALVTTLSACGDVNRNVMCCPAPIRNHPVRDAMQKLADDLATHLSPRSTAYAEVWLNGKQCNRLDGRPPEDVEPIYGKLYLPRKFKAAIALPEDNCVDVLSNDLAILVSHRNGRIEGYNIYAGGGLGTTHGQAKTYPRLATPVCFATPDEVMAVGTAVVKVQRDFGNRDDRKQARLKYTIDRLGVEAFRDKVLEYVGKPLPPVNADRITGIDDHLGWHEQGDGRLWVGVPVLCGRLHDRDGVTLKATIRDIVKKHRPSLRISATQNLLLCDLPPAARADVELALAQGGFPRPELLPKIERHGMACVATPTCGLALAESERVMKQLVNNIHAELAVHGLTNEDIVLHMTGCPNGCARPFNAEIGLVGRSPGKYQLFLGGCRRGTHLAFPYQDHVAFDAIAERLRGPLLLFKSQRHPNEEFGAFCRRLGKEALTAPA